MSIEKLIEAQIEEYIATNIRRRYEIRFEFAQGYNVAEIAAESPEAALAQAQKMDPYEAEFGDNYDISFSELEAISIRDPEDGNEYLVHVEPDTKLRQAAQDLFDACLMVLAAGGDLNAIDFEMIRNAVRKAGAQ